MSGAAAHAAEAFTERFGVVPDGVWRAPGRVNLIGEHTDYSDGFVMPFAIERATYVAARARNDETIGAASTAFGDAGDVSIHELVPGRVGGWAAYVHGAIAETAALIGALRGLDLMVHSDVPAGAGLSSSAALECSVASAVADLHGARIERVELALAAQRAEHRFAGVPCGVMDQMASMFGERGHALLIDIRTLALTPVPLRIPSHSLVVVDTRVRHALADGAYAERRRSCEEAARILGAEALRDVAIEQVEDASARLGDELFRRARHVVTENARVLDVADALESESYERVGAAMASSHESLRGDFEVSSPELDLAVETAVAAGALGARMTGAGFGGSIVAVVPDDQARDVRAAIEDAFARARYRAPSWMVVEPSDGAARIA